MPPLFHPESREAKALRVLIDAFNKKGITPAKREKGKKTRPLFVFGGAVRDALLSRQSPSSRGNLVGTDLDLLFSGTDNELNPVIKALKKEKKIAFLPGVEQPNSWGVYRIIVNLGGGRKMGVDISPFSKKSRKKKKGGTKSRLKSRLAYSDTTVNSLAVDARHALSHEFSESQIITHNNNESVNHVKTGVFSFNDKYAKRSSYASILRAVALQQKTGLQPSEDAKKFLRERIETVFDDASRHRLNYYRKKLLDTVNGDALRAREALASWFPDDPKKYKLLQSILPLKMEIGVDKEGYQRIDGRDLEGESVLLPARQELPHSRLVQRIKEELGPNSTFLGTTIETDSDNVSYLVHHIDLDKKMDWDKVLGLMQKQKKFNLKVGGDPEESQKFYVTIARKFKPGSNGREMLGKEPEQAKKLIFDKIGSFEYRRE
jgi:hypothetical protein